MPRLAANLSRTARWGPRGADRSESVGRERRATDASLGGRPSGVARDRLARRIRTDVADVRVRLEEAMLRSDALLATGQPERAAAVLHEQQALLAELRETLSSSVAAAMAEAEAEAVLAGSPDGTTLFGDPAGHEVPAPRRTFRSTASALVSAVAALAVLLVAAPPPPDTLAASDRQDGAGLPDGASTVGAPDAAEADLVAGAEPGAGPTEIELRRLFGTRAPSTSGGDDGAGGSGLSQLQALVDQFVATVVRAAGGLTPATLPILRIDDADPAAPPARSADAADGGDLGTAGDEQPAPEPAAAEDRRPEDGAEEPPPAEDDPEEEPGVELPSADGNATVPGLARSE